MNGVDPMQYTLNRTIITHQRAVVKNMGDTFWKYLCSHLPVDAPFTLKDATNAIQRNRPDLAPTTCRNYARVILNNVAGQNGSGLYRITTRLWEWQTV